MTVTAHPKDAAGAAKQVEVTALTAASAATSSPLAKAAVDAKLLQAQVELVSHYMSIGRINPATVLSTLS